MDKQMLTRVGLVVAVGVIVYCMIRMRSSGSGEGVLADQGPETFEGYEDGEREEDEYEEEYEEEDEYEEEYEEEDETDGDAYTLMEPTLDDSRANAMFEPGM